MFKRFLAATTSLLLVSSMLTACSSNDDSSSKEKVNKEVSSIINDEKTNDKDSTAEEQSSTENSDSSESEQVMSKSAKEEYNAEISKLKDLANKTKGTIGVDFVYDAAESDQKGTWADLIQTINSQSKEVNFDMSLSLTAQWADNIAFVDIKALDESILSFGSDDSYYYFDLSHIEPVCKEIGIWDESFEEKNENGIAMTDLLQTIKIPKAELDEFLQGQGITNTETGDLNEEFKSMLSYDKIMEAMKTFAEKAEFDEGDIVINNITSQDMQGFKDILNSLDNTALINSTDIAKAESDSSDLTTGTTMSYRLKYDSEKIDQVHELTGTDEKGDNISFYINISEDTTVDLTPFNNAKDFKDIMGISFGDFASIINSRNSTDIDTPTESDATNSSDSSTIIY